MPRGIPVPVIAVASRVLSDSYSHATLNQFFMRANAPGEPPLVNKMEKCRFWFGEINNSHSDPLGALGKVIEEFMDVPLEWADPYVDPRAERQRQLLEVMAEYGLSYARGGRVIVAGISTATKTLADFIKARDLPSIDAEFQRALEAAGLKPREAVSAASNTVEAVCKEYIEAHAAEGLKMPAKTDLRGVWPTVRDHLGFNPASVADDDLKRILSGLASIVDGLSALRTHASSAHSADPRLKGYTLEPRHARLAINAAHSLVVFILESWDKRAGRPS